MTRETSGVDRVLCVVNKPLRPATTGHRVRLQNLIGGSTARRATDILVVTPSTRPAELAHKGDQMWVPPKLTRPTPVGLFRWLAGRCTWQMTRTSLDADGFDQLAPSYDAVLYGGALVAEEISRLELPSIATAPVILDLPHLESDLQNDAAPHRASLRTVLDRRSSRSIEARMIARAAIVCCTTPAHLHALHSVTSAPVVLIPNGVDTTPPAPRTAGSTVIMLGNHRYRPNADALRWACEEILPAVRTRHPQMTAEVVGWIPPDLEAFAQREGVVVRGFVDDLDAALADGTVLLAPLRTGSGTKTKILDAMARGLPVVTTSVGAEGLGLTDGRDVLIGDDAASLANAVAGLMADPDRAATIGAAARQLVQRQFSWASITDRMERLVWGPVLSHSSDVGSTQ
jgi:glycosyltransferase involved in cell wall biosynthesis